MPFNLLETVSSYITPDVVSKASSLLGESTANTQKAMTGIVPTVLAGVVNTASSQGGASRLMGMLQSSGLGGGLLNNVSNVFSGGSATEETMASGQNLLGNLFGNRTDVIGAALSSFSGIKSGSASSLLAMAAPLVMSVIGKQQSAQGLNASGLANMLMGQKDKIAAALPPGLASAAGVSSFLGGAGAAAAGAAGEAGSAMKKWLPIIVIVLVALALWAYLRGCGASVKNAMSQIKLPNGITLSLPEGSFNYNLATFLANGSNSELPKTFVFDRLNFDSATTRLTPDSNQTVTDLVAILKAYPNAEVQLAGHTDSTGDPAANQKLSLDRANAVKDTMVSAGIDANRISTVGYGQDKPIASNDTEEGRAKNRRLELVVTKK